MPVAPRKRGRAGSTCGGKTVRWSDEIACSGTETSPRQVCGKEAPDHRTLLVGAVGKRRAGTPTPDEELTQEPDTVDERLLRP